MLRIESQEIAGLISHQGTRGSANENSLKSVLSKVLPPSVRVSAGEIIDREGTVSAQMDSLVLSNTSHPILFAQTDDELIFPVESVLLAIEVKGNMSKEDVEVDIVEKIRRHQKLTAPEGAVPAFAVFAHKATAQPRTIAKWFFGLPEDARPSFFLVNDAAFFGILDARSPDGYQVIMPFAPGADEPDSYKTGDPVISDVAFWKPVDAPMGSQVRIDHGAGMLLFVKAVLDILSERGYAEVEWLDRYLDKISTKHIRYSKDGDPVMELS